MTVSFGFQDQDHHHDHPRQCRHYNYIIIPCFWLLVFLSSTTVVVGQASVTCEVGWGSSSRTHTVDSSRIDDGYCDCPTTGVDEPNTDACSGSQHWKGSLSSETQTWFVCPQQPDIKLPRSRINDGICDCCDGADEGSHSHCPDHCESILRAAREERQRLEDNFQKGYAIRNEQIQAFQTFWEQAQQDRSNIQDQLVALRQEEDNIHLQVQEGKRQYLEQRLQQTKDVVNNEIVQEMLQPLTNQELQAFLTNMCQTAGELEDTVDSKTCIPLRLAGLDAGLLWTSGESVERGEPQLLADILDYNIHNSRKAWKAHHLHDKSGRRLMEEYDEEEDLFYDEYDIDANVDDEYEDSAHETPTFDKEDTTDDDAAKKREQVLEEVKTRPFARQRIKFLDNASILIEKIQTMIEEQDAKETGDEITENEEEDTDSIIEEDSVPDFDPLALPMVRKELDNRKALIERGLNFSASAKVLLDAWWSFHYDDAEARRDDLILLVSQTMYHSKLSLEDIWKAYIYAIQDFVDMLPPEETGTCQSPWAGLCPPWSITRIIGNKNISLPPSSLLSSAVSHCQSAEGSNTEHACALAENIPSQVADGYFGYYKPTSRDEDSAFFSGLYEPLKFDDNDATRSSLEQLEDQLKRAKQDVKSAESREKEIETSLGGIQGKAKYGPDGELYSIGDACYSVVEGKYEYEICLFGQAKQKDKGVKHGGTSLGTWTGASFDDESNRRVWKWERGQKCWNGPERSATAYVTCGPETKVLSADEPDTCRYVLAVESPIACDEVYRSSHNL